jgi:hypothetical protein
MTRTHTIALFLAGAIGLAGCGGNGDKKATTDPVAYCVQRTVELYKKHDLPFSKPEAERPALCRQWMDDRDAHTIAQIEIAMRQFDQEMRELKK